MKRSLIFTFVLGAMAALPQLGRADFLPERCGGAPVMPTVAPRRIFLVMPGAPDWPCNHLTANAPSPTYQVNSVAKALQCADGEGDEVQLGTNLPGGVVRTYPGFSVVGKKKGTLARPLVIKPANAGTIILDPQGSPSVDYKGIIEIVDSQYVIITGFRIQNSANRAPPPASQTKAERGITIHNGKGISIFSNTISNIGREAIAMDGADLLVRGNAVNQVATFQWYRSGGANWDGGVTSSNDYPTTCARWESNTINNVRGEGLDVLRVDNALVSRNTISDALSVNLYVDGSKNVTLDGNHIYATAAAPTLNDPTFGPLKATGIMLAREYTTSASQVSYPLGDVLVSNNVIDSTGQGIRYWGGSHPQSWFFNLRIMYNTILRSQLNGIKIDAPQLQPAGTNRIHNNIVKRAPGSPGADVYIHNFQWAWGTSYNRFVTSAGPYPGAPSPDTVNTRDDPGLKPVLGNKCSYRLILASNPNAAREKATVTLVTTDTWGLTRGAKPSIGADEYRATNPACP